MITAKPGVWMEVTGVINSQRPSVGDTFWIHTTCRDGLASPIAPETRLRIKAYRRPTVFCRERMELEPRDGGNVWYRGPNTQILVCKKEVEKYWGFLPLAVWIGIEAF
jgi:hypothetical protein